MALTPQEQVDVWWCQFCKLEWSCPSIPHNPICPTCGHGGWWRRFQEEA
jgi:rubrerythrin